jgi:hypothetical protein
MRTRSSDLSGWRPCLTATKTSTRYTSTRSVEAIATRIGRIVDRKIWKEAPIISHVVTRKSSSKNFSLNVLKDDIMNSVKFAVVCCLMEKQFFVFVVDKCRKP